MTSADRLILGNLDLVQMVAKSMVRQRVGLAFELDDLVGYGAIGLVRASRGFDPKRGVPFRGYAGACIYKAIIDGLGLIGPFSRGRVRRWRETGGRVRVPVRVPLNEAAGVADDAPLADELLARTEARRLARDAVADLPPRLAAVVRRIWFEGEQYQAVSAAYGHGKPWATKINARAIALLGEAPGLREAA